MNWQTELMNGNPVRHKPSGDIIDPATVEAIDGGALVCQNGGWRLYPDSELVPIASQATNDAYSAPDLPKKSQVNAEATAAYSYFFGLDSFQAELRQAENTACLTIEDLGLIGCDKLELEAMQDMPDRTAIEYSLVESGIEYPILPVGQTQIKDELLFYGLPVRFAINPAYPVVVKKGGEVTSLSISEAINKKDAVYTVDYVAANGSCYEPAGKNVGLKVVLRRYKDTAPSPRVISILMRQWGRNE